MCLKCLSSAQMCVLSRECHLSMDASIMHCFNATFFREKISQLRLTLSTNPPRAVHYPSPLVPPPDFSILPPATEDEILKLILDRPNKQCGLDAFPTSLLKQCSCVLDHSHRQPESCCWWVSPSAETVYYHSPSQETLSGQRKSF